MLSKLKHLYPFLRLGTQTGLKSCRCITSVADPLKAKNSSDIAETPELPEWVKISEENTAISKPEDDDFVPPSMSYWIENHKIHDQEGDMKSIADDIVESDVDKISKVLTKQFKNPDLVVKALNGCDADISKSLTEQILKRFSCEWIPAFGFFKWSELQNGIAHSPDICDLMVDNLGKSKKFDLMWELVEKMNSLGGHVTLDTMTKVLRRLAKAGKYEDAVEAFRKMDLFGVERDITSMNVLMDALVKHGSVEQAQSLFLDFKELIPPNLQTYNVLVHGWCKSRQISKAEKTMNDMKDHGFYPDSITYTSLIESYCREKDFRKVDTTLEQMRKDGLSPSIVTYTIIMKALAKAKDMNKTLEIYEKMKQNNCSPDAAFYSVFIYALSATGRLIDFDTVLEDMSKHGIVPDVCTYNTLITIAARYLQEEKALKLLLKMEESRCKPELDTYSPLLKMCCQLKRMKMLSFLLSHMFKNDVSIDLGTYSLLVSRLSRNGKLDHACSFFEDLVLKGFVPMECTYETLVKKLEKNGMHKEKQRIEELMSTAKQQVSNHSSMTLTETKD